MAPSTELILAFIEITAFILHYHPQTLLRNLVFRVIQKPFNFIQTENLILVLFEN